MDDSTDKEDVSLALNKHLLDNLRVLLPSLSNEDFNEFCNLVSLAIFAYKGAELNEEIRDTPSQRIKRAKAIKYHASQLLSSLMEREHSPPLYFPNGDENVWEENPFEPLPLAMVVDAGGEPTDEDEEYPKLYIRHPEWVLCQMLGTLKGSADTIVKDAEDERKRFPRKKPTFARMVFIEALLDQTIWEGPVSTDVSFYDSGKAGESPYKGIILEIIKLVLDDLGEYRSIETIFDDIKKIKSKWHERSIENGFNDQE